MKKEEAAEASAVKTEGKKGRVKAEPADDETDKPKPRRGKMGNASSTKLKQERGEKSTAAASSAMDLEAWGQSRLDTAPTSRVDDMMARLDMLGETD